MLALVLLAIGMPAMVCAVCSAWIWFATLAVLAGFGA